MEYITAHEADQRAATKLPLGMDYQGRNPEAAHVSTSEGADDDYEGSLFGALEGLLSWQCLSSMVLFATCIAAAIFLPEWRP